MDVILNLQAHDNAALSFLNTLAPYLSDPACYDQAPPPGNIISSAFTASEEQQMLNHKFHVHTGPIRGCVYGFKAAQYFKGCTRPVWDCRIKEAFVKELPHYHLQSQATISRRLFSIASGDVTDTVFVQFDFAAYYDQFPLTPEVSASFCFKGRNGETFALSRLPMGFTLACAIAQATTWQLLNFDRKSTVFTCIDNVAFAGNIHDVAHDVRLFLDRCHTAEATLNDHTTDAVAGFLSSTPMEQLNSVRSWHSDEFTFLGVRYSWPTAHKSLAPKSIDKLAAAKQCLELIGDYILPRQLAAVVGLLRHASGTLALPGYHRYPALAWIGRVASLLQADLTLWDRVSIRLPIAHRLAMLDWFDEVLAPRSIPIFSPIPTELPPTIIADASALGWGGILLQDNQITAASGTWTAPIQSSVTAEPEGIWHVACRLLPPSPPVVTDHLPLVFASLSLFPRAASYNALMLRLKRVFPASRFVFSHLAGVSNPTDSMSRDGTMDSITLERVCTIAGSGWFSALSLPDTKPCVLCKTSLPWQC